MCCKFGAAYAQMPEAFIADLRATVKLDVLQSPGQPARKNARKPSLTCVQQQALMCCKARGSLRRDARKAFKLTAQLGGPVQEYALALLPVLEPLQGDLVLRFRLLHLVDLVQLARMLE